MHCTICKASSYATAYVWIKIQWAVLLPTSATIFSPAAKSSLDPLGSPHCGVCGGGIATMPLLSPSLFLETHIKNHSADDWTHILKRRDFNIKVLDFRPKMHHFSEAITGPSCDVFSKRNRWCGANPVIEVDWLPRKPNITHNPERISHVTSRCPCHHDLWADLINIHCSGLRVTFRWCKEPNK